MLSSLYIKNVAVIKEASIDFQNGFTALTGETGAGKSIIIGAISSVLGDRVSKDIIRTGSDKAVITAFFNDLHPSVKVKLENFNIEDVDEIQIYREVKANGKSICKINSVPVTIAMLKELGVLLMSIQGQHDTYELLSPDIHGKYLDNYGNLLPLLKEYQEQFQKLKTIKNELDKLTIDQSDKERKIDLLKFQIEEIEEANIIIGERETLSNRRKVIRDSELIMNCLNSLSSLLYGEGELSGTIDLINNSSIELEKFIDLVPNFEDIVSKLRDVEYNLQDIANEVEAVSENIDYSQEELEYTEERLNFLYKLSLKYGNSEEEILNLLEKSKKELENIELSDDKIIALNDEFNQAKKISVELAKQLSQERKKYALEFSNKVKKELEFLNMPNIEFSVELERTNLSMLGCDKVSFMVCANKGEQLKPMSKIASGGELSRIMLAIKTVLSSGDNVATMIFDEIDAGISGEAANKVGKKLKQAAKDRQIICITHLAQMAALADNHLFIKKETIDNETYTTVKELDENSRVNEITRIISGEKITDLKLKMAKEMLENSKKQV